MNKKQIVDEVTKYLEPILAEFNYELVDVEFVKEGPTFYLRIYIDKEGGITIEDCRVTSRTIEPVLDEKDIIEPAYMLEVSSPGLDRVIKKDKDFERFNGEVVDVKLYTPINKQKTLQGELISKTDELLTICDEEGETIEIPMKNVVVVRLAILF
ncbi:ribosome maturation factor RimP [Niameybacter massiliensis]|uniref:Ribosome maturation factor RimP n=1 Tax=Holtiella tumoricola TaxID=3018743 RepID=A0AA42DPU3_9FIRM|nr:ribosome maturation factor RimP [Holtiella tumoricola]MDA3732626.1 ribosome maturation factor RimP [Holtiella tumoricola]